MNTGRRFNLVEDPCRRGTIAVLIVAGLSLKNLEPRLWDSASPFCLPTLSAVMVSYADFHRMAARRSAAMRMGLRAFLGVPDHISVYLDNGAFFFGSQKREAPLEEYEEFVEQAKPDWKPIPQDYIPFPSMSWQEQRSRYAKTMRMNQTYQHNGYVPVVHIGKYLTRFIACISADDSLSRKSCLALGGIVPNLLRKPSAIPYSDVLSGLRHVRQAFRDKSIHVFGVGGTATLHLTSLLEFDSVDSSGWRNRAARGIVQLPGCGERLVANLGNWRGRHPSPQEWTILRGCRCPACQKHGIEGLKAKKLLGFCCRATHNLWILLEENRWLVEHITAGTYERHYLRRLDNSVYKPLLSETLRLLREDRPS